MGWNHERHSKCLEPNCAKTGQQDMPTQVGDIKYIDGMCAHLKQYVFGQMIMR